MATHVPTRLMGADLIDTAGGVDAAPEPTTSSGPPLKLPTDAANFKLIDARQLGQFLALVGDDDASRMLPSLTRTVEVAPPTPPLGAGQLGAGQPGAGQPALAPTSTPASPTPSGTATPPGTTTPPGTATPTPLSTSSLPATPLPETPTSALPQPPALGPNGAAVPLPPTSALPLGQVVEGGLVLPPPTGDPTAAGSSSKGPGAPAVDGRPFAPVADSQVPDSVRDAYLPPGRERPTATALPSSGVVFGSAFIGEPITAGRTSVTLAELNTTHMAEQVKAFVAGAKDAPMRVVMLQADWQSTPLTHTRAGAKELAAELNMALNQAFDESSPVRADVRRGPDGTFVISYLPVRGEEQTKFAPLIGNRGFELLADPRAANVRPASAGLGAAFLAGEGGEIVGHEGVDSDMGSAAVSEQAAWYQAWNALGNMGAGVGNAAQDHMTIASTSLIAVAVSLLLIGPNSWRDIALVALSAASIGMFVGTFWEMAVADTGTLRSAIKFAQYGFPVRAAIRYVASRARRYNEPFEYFVQSSNREPKPLRNMFRRFMLRITSRPTSTDFAALATLGLNENASWTDIVSAFRQLVKENHPDSVGNSRLSTERMTAITSAYATLRYRRKSTPV